MPTGDLPGWHQTFADNFSGSALQPCWEQYAGFASSSNTQWSPSHIAVSGGKAELFASNDATAGRYLDGGMSTLSCLLQTYGKYDVMFRMDPGVGVKHAILMWPQNDASWPCAGEIDFSEDSGSPGDRQSTTLTIHYCDASGANQQLPQQTLNLDLTHYHRLGVEWLPSGIQWTLDGANVGTRITTHIPSGPMKLALQSETPSVSGSTPARVNLDVDWVVAYTPTTVPPTTTTTTNATTTTVAGTTTTRPATTTTRPATTTTTVGGPTTTAPPGSVCGQAGTPATRQKVVVFAFENRTWSSVGGVGFGDPTMPYLHGLAQRCPVFSDYTEPNTSQNSATQYVGQDAGSTANSVLNDCDPSASCQSTQDNIFRQARVAGLVPRSFVEGATTGCSTSGNTPHHVGQVYFFGTYTQSGVTHNDHDFCATEVRPYTEFDPNNVPDFSFISPNNTDNGHDTANSVADAWASRNIQPVLNSAAYKAGQVTVFVWYDEDHPVPNMQLGIHAKAGVNTTPVNYCATLRAWDEMLGVPLLACAVTASDIRPMQNISYHSPETDNDPLTWAVLAAGATAASIALIRRRRRVMR